MRALIPSMFVAAACAAGSPPSVPTTAKPGPSPAASPSIAPAPVPPTAGEFAASPLTPLAHELREIAFAAIDRRPLPRTAIPIGESPERERAVRGRAPPSRELTAFAFAMEISLLFGDPNAEGDGESIEALAFLSRAGLKVATLEARSGRRKSPLPPWLAGVEPFGADLLAALRNRRIGDLLVGEAERPVVNDDFLYQRLLKGRPKLEQLAELEQMTARHSRVGGYRFDDVYVVARDARGTIWGLKLEIENRDGQLVLDGSPLVKVEEVKPEPSRAEPESGSAPGGS